MTNIAKLFLAVLIVILAGCAREPQWEYDVDAYWTIDPALFTFVPDGEWPAGFDEPRALAIGPGDKVYIAGDRGLRVFTIDGSLLGDKVLASSPRSLAVDEYGTVYVGYTDTIQIFRPQDGAALDGTSLEAGAIIGPLPDNALITSLAVDDENLYAADAANRVLLRMNHDGEVIGRIGQADEDRGIPGIILPNPQFDVSAGADGLIRVNNPGRLRVEVYSASGHLEFSWGESGLRTEAFSGCCNPTNVAVLSDSSVITAEKGIPRVKHYDLITGKMLGVVAGPEVFGGRIGDYGEGFAGFELAVDSRDRVVLLDPRSRTVRIFASKETANE